MICADCLFRDTGINTGFEKGYCHIEKDIVDTEGTCPWWDERKPTPPASPVPGTETTYTVDTAKGNQYQIKTWWEKGGKK